MSIKIPGKPGGPAGIPGAEGGDVGGVKAPKPAGGSFADKLGGPGAPGGPGGPGGPAGPRAPDAISAIAAELKAGKLTPKQAVDRILDLTVDKGAAAHLPAKVKEKIRADLEALLSSDPLLAQKARRLGLEVGGDGGGEGEG
jgi:hypothetical protein